MNGCRVRIVNDLKGETVTVETPRERGAVFFDLARLIRSINQRREDILRASLHLCEDMIVLHWHNPWVQCSNLAVDMLKVFEPVHNLDEIIWGKDRKGGDS